MKKILLFLLCQLLFTNLFAQTQQGVVKTRGRMVNGVLQPGKGLAGATVQVKDHNALLSGVDGKFSFLLRTKAEDANGTDTDMYPQINGGDIT